MARLEEKTVNQMSGQTPVPSGYADFSPRRARRVDADMSEYIRLVNAQLSQLATIRYSDVFRSLHGDGEMIRDALDRGVSVEEFVEVTIGSFGLKRNDGETSPDLVHGYNTAQAAVCEFAMRDGDWHLAMDGRVYRREEDGLASLEPIRMQRSIVHGFATFFHDGASIGEDGRPLNLGDPTPISVGMDIADAVTAYANRRGDEPTTPRR